MNVNSKNNEILDGGAIETVVVTPSTWQLAYNALPKDVRQRIYNTIRDKIKDTTSNPHKEEYDAAKKEFEKLGDNYWPDNAMEITNRFDKAITDYHKWEPLNSEEGYQALKDYYDSPNERLVLGTYPYFSEMWISHSDLRGPRGSIDVKMSDPGYNLITNNCSDATKRALEYVKGTKMPERWYSMTTPNKVRKWAVETLHALPLIKGDSLLRPDKLEYMHIPDIPISRNYYDRIADIIPLSIEELARWYNYIDNETHAK